MADEIQRVHCPDCKTRVTSNVVAEYAFFDVEYQEEPIRLRIVRCPDCHLPQVLVQTYDKWGPGDHEEGYSDGERLWPEPERRLSYEIPKNVRQSVIEARKCMDCGTYNAASVMCGRALEALCGEFKTGNGRLQTRLTKLREMGVIDGRLYEWSEALRLHRNLGAHNFEEPVSEVDVKDLLMFTEAICDYVFVLHARFEEYSKRQGKGDATP